MSLDFFECILFLDYGFECEPILEHSIDLSMKYKLYKYIWVRTPARDINVDLSVTDAQWTDVLKQRM